MERSERPAGHPCGNIPAESALHGELGGIRRRDTFRLAHDPEYIICPLNAQVKDRPFFVKIGGCTALGERPGLKSRKVGLSDGTDPLYESSAQTAAILPIRPGAAIGIAGNGYVLSVEDGIGPMSNP